MSLLGCVECGATFPARVVVGGIVRKLDGRQRCLDCLPYRQLTHPRKAVFRESKQLVCEKCGSMFAAKQVIDGRTRSLYRRRFCLSCSPFGAHNTSAIPPAEMGPDARRERRRRRHNASSSRSLKKRLRGRKERLVAAFGGRCGRCGYATSLVALDFHHRNGSEKDFAISSFHGSWERLRAEAAKYDLLCACCHRIEHAIADAAIDVGPVVKWRRGLKARAVAFMGGSCDGCGYHGPDALFDFHHRDASTKEFGIGQDGIPRRWDKVVAELGKCVMVCANCHREVHAGVRVLDKDLPGLAEERLEYAA